MKILNIGSINKDYFYSVDNFAKPGETISSKSYKISLGGKGLNQSVAISKAGIKVFHVGKINKEDRWIINKLKNWNINCDHIEFSENPTGHAVIQVNDKGENSIIIHHGANHMLNIKKIIRTLSSLKKGDFVVIQNEVNYINEIINISHQNELKIFFNPAPYSKKILTYNLEKISVLILNQTEGENLSRKKTPSEIIEKLNQKYRDTEIILTLGDKGSFYSFNNETIKIESEKVKTIDTTAAGDTFIGFYIASIASGMDVKNSLNRASKAAAISTTIMGGAESIPEIN